LAKSHNALFWETSAKTGENADECFLNVTQEIYKKVDSGEIDITNEALGVKHLKPLNSRGTSQGLGGNCEC
jgi:Ras-related protein Rab-2A